MAGGQRDMLQLLSEGISAGGVATPELPPGRDHGIHGGPAPAGQGREEGQHLLIGREGNISGINLLRGTDDPDLGGGGCRREVWSGPKVRGNTKKESEGVKPAPQIGAGSFGQRSQHGRSAARARRRTGGAAGRGHEAPVVGDPSAVAKPGVPASGPGGWGGQKI